MTSMFNTIYNFVTGKSADPISPVIEEDTTLQTTPITKMQEEIDEDVNNEIEKTISDDKDLIFEKGVLLKQKYAKFLFTYKEILEKGTNEDENEDASEDEDEIIEDASEDEIIEDEDEIIEELTIIKEETEESETEESEKDESEKDELTSSVSKWIPREESEESEKAESEEDESEEDDCVISPNQLPKKVRFQIKKHVLKASIEIEPVE